MSYRRSRPIIIAASAALVVASVSLASPAMAFDLFGLKLFDSGQADATITDPLSYKVDVSTSGATGALDSAIRNASGLLTNQGKPASGTIGLLALARGDYQSITSALYAQGYYGGTVHILVAGREATAVPIDATLKGPVAVKVIVNPGPPFVFGRLSIADRAPPTANPDDQVPSPESLGFLPGQPALSGVVLKAEQTAIDAWKQQGYAEAKSVKRQVVADHRTHTLDVTIALAPGPKATIGPVSVTGTKTLDPGFVAYETGLHPGDEYDPDLITKANKRLSRLEMFRSQRIAEQDMGLGGVLPFQVIVQELPLHRFGVGASYSTVDGLGLQGYWLARNLFGRAERLRIDAAVSNIAFPLDVANFDYSVGGTFTKPGVFNPDTDLIASLTAARDNLPGYDETSVAGKVGLNYAYSDTITLQGGVDANRSNVDDAFGSRDFLTTGVYGEATLDTRDSTTDPTRGLYVDATLSPYYEYYFGTPQLRATAEARTYYGFGDSNKFVLAGRVKAGALLGPDISEIPPDELFFAGGGGSVRGYAYKSIGVTGPGGALVGGRYLLEGSLEGRMRLNDSFGLAAFADAGYVAASDFPASVNDFRVGVGVGVRYYTGFGPIRLDVATPLNPRPGDPSYALYLGLGQAF